MSRRDIRGQDASVSLFPFLAVLICTMGALILLLVIVVQQAGLQADAAPTEEMAAEPSIERPTVETRTPEPASVESGPREERQARAAQLREERDSLIWQAGLLSQSREATLARVEEARLELSHLEEHARELEANFERLRDEAQLMVEDHNQAATDSVSTDQELEQLLKEIEDKEKELEELEATQTGTAIVYSIVPYEGSQGTSRRPIYIECFAERVVIQPEGIELLSEDFSNATDPSNALAAAIRAAREYLVSSDPRGENGDPYPLLVVRPEGARSYAASRSAMLSWDDQFGYELVTADMKLAYPPPDPRLAELLQQSIDHARNQRRLVEKWESDSRPSVTYQASRNGGFTASTPTGEYQRGDSFGSAGDRNDAAGTSNQTTVGTGSEGGHDDSGNVGAGFALSPDGRQSSGGLAGSDVAAGGVSTGGAGLGGGDWPADDELASDSGSPLPTGRGGGYGAGEGGYDSGGYGSIYDDSPGSSSASDAGQNSYDRDGDFASQSPADSSSADGLGHRAGGMGEAGSSTPSSGGGTASGGAADGSLTKGGSGGSESQNGNSTDAAAAGAGAASGGSPAGGPGQTMVSIQHGQTEAQSPLSQSPLSDQRGENWALPNAASGAIPITRPLKMVFGADGVRLPGEAGTRQETRFVAWSDPTEKTVDPVVEIIWQRIEDWGIAGSGVYWKPILEAEVAPGLDHRMSQFEALLQDSGLQLIRR